MSKRTEENVMVCVEPCMNTNYSNRPGRYRHQLAGRAARPTPTSAYPKPMTTKVSEQPLLRSELGDVLRSLRSLQGRTLREVSSDAQVSLGYLSEVERGQKEASSELLDSICKALRVPLWFVLREVSERMMLLDKAVVPDTVPDDLLSPQVTGLP